MRIAAAMELVAWAAAGAALLRAGMPPWALAAGVVLGALGALSMSTPMPAGGPQRLP